MDRKQLFATLAIVLCAFQLASADEDCKNLKDRVDEMEQCCQTGPIIPQNQADNCSSAADDASDPRDKMMCVLQCKLQSLGVMVGKQVVQEKVLEYANRFEGEWKKTATEIVTECNERLNKMQGHIDQKAANMECSPVGGFLMMCLMKQTFDKCPSDKWQNTDFCNKIKSGACFKRPE